MHRYVPRVERLSTKSSPNVVFRDVTALSFQRMNVVYRIDRISKSFRQPVFTAYRGNLYFFSFSFDAYYLCADRE